jgi:HK97 family phage major capsid protein
MNLKKLYEERNAKITSMKSILSKMETEERAEMSTEEAAEFDKTEKEVRALEETIARAERTRDLKLNVITDDRKEELRAEEAALAEERAFANYIRGIVEERADVNLTTGDNGAVIPSSIANKIIKKVYDICPIYQLATRYNVGGTLNTPYYDETTQSITMAYATEFVELESTSGKFLSIELKGFLAGALSKVSKSLVNNSDFNIVNFVVNAMADSISKWIENELLNGTTNKVAGLSTVTQKVDAASATAITADELIDLQEEVPDLYQAGAIWIMKKATRKAIRKLKDGDGTYLLQKDFNARWGYTLLGKDVYTSDNMPGMEAGKTAIYYGDMSGLAVKLSENVSIEVLREKFATQHAIGVVGWIEIDSKVENAQKIAKLVMKAV